MSNISIIIQREFNERVRKKSFIITTLLMPVPVSYTHLTLPTN